MTFSDLGLGQSFSNQGGVYNVQISRSDGDYGAGANPYWYGLIQLSNFAGGKGNIMSTLASNQLTSVSINSTTKIVTWVWSVTAPTMIASYSIVA